MNMQTFNVAFGVAVDKAFLPPVAGNITTEIRNRVQNMVSRETYHLWGVSFDRNSVHVTEVDGVRAYTVSFQVSIENDDTWSVTYLREEIARRTFAMVMREIDLYLPGGVSFDPATVAVASATAPEPVAAPTAPVDMRPGARTPATVPTTPVFVEPEPAPKRRWWHRKG